MLINNLYGDTNMTTSTTAIISETAPNYNTPCLSFSKQMELHGFIDSLGFHIAESRKNNPKLTEELREIYQQFERLFDYYAEYVHQNSNFTKRDKNILIACMKQAISELHRHDPNLKKQFSDDDFLIKRAKANHLKELIPILKGEQLLPRQNLAISEDVLRGLSEDPILLNYNARYKFGPSALSLILTACAFGAFAVIGFWALAPLVLIPLAILAAPYIQKRFGTSLKDVASDFNTTCAKGRTPTLGNNESNDSITYEVDGVSYDNSLNDKDYDTNRETLDLDGKGESYTPGSATIN